jgi:hypothetical protein
LFCCLAGSRLGIKELIWVQGVDGKWLMRPAMLDSGNNAGLVLKAPTAHALGYVDEVGQSNRAGVLLSPGSALRCWEFGVPVASVSTRRLLFIPKQKGEPLNKKTPRALITTAGGVVKMPLIPEMRFRSSFLYV